MKNFFILAIIVALSCSCSSTKQMPGQGKTPYTKTGKFNSCMFDEAYKLKEQGKLNNPKLDVWTTSQEILISCRKKLSIPEQEINATQSLNIISSTITSIR